MLYKIVIAIVGFFIKLWFKVDVIGEENLHPKTDKPIMYIANHVSWLDALFMSVILPKDVPFVVFSGTMNTWWAKLLLMFGPTPISVDSASPYAVKTMVKVLTDPNGPRKIAIYPEGRLSTTGGMMKIQSGAGMIALKTDVLIVPMNLKGVEHLKLNRLQGKVHKLMRPKITITVGKPCSIENIDADLMPKQQRNIATNQVEHILLNVGLQSEEEHPTQMNLTQTFFDAMNRNGQDTEIVDDIRSCKLSYTGLARMSVALGDYITKHTIENKEEGCVDAPIGVLLPNAGASIAVMLGISFFGKSFHPMNFSIGPNGISSICKTLRIKNVITAKGFIEKGKLEPLVEAMKALDINIIYAEDMKKELGLSSKIKAIIFTKFPQFLKGYKTSPDEIMTILATSGSEGDPKGVCLTHTNMLSDIEQVLRVIDVSGQDRFLNAMPIFHSFGLMGGVLLPLIKGAWSFQYPSPLHGRVIPALSYDRNITIAFATDTFLNIWARNADSYSFYKIRAIVAGAEKVKDTTKRMYAEKFGVRILEGYGATETAPVIALNTFIHSKAGSVGKLLPGMKAKLESVPGIDNGGKLLVAGPNVMKGYILAKNPGKLLPAEEYYDTGDIVSIDNEGFIEILARAKRFAKIAGEMVSLPLVESIIDKTFIAEVEAQKNNVGPARAGTCGNAVISIPDDKKGEKLIWFTTLSFDNEKEMIAKITNAVKTEGITELAIPKTIKHIEKIPLLGTGKTSYPELTKLV